MRKNVARGILLGILIITCIAQTIILWLGNTSSHNFFASDYGSYAETMLYPKEIWSNINRSIYKIEGSNEESGMRYRMLEELYNEIRRERMSVELETKLSYSELLTTTTGVIYKYGTTLGLEEVVGQTLKSMSGKGVSDQLRALYVDLGSGSRTIVYLVNEVEGELEGEKDLEVTYKLTLGSQLKVTKNIIDHFRDMPDDTEVKTYQASILSISDSELFEGNTFYPVNNEGQPISYQTIRLLPLVSNVEDERLEPYINALLKNASQTRVLLPDGATFSDNTNMSIRYNNVGTLEFNKASSVQGDKSGRVDKLGKVMTFISHSKAIPENLKKGLYLQEIRTTKQGETQYLFGYQYGGMEVLLSKGLKEQLGVETFVSIVVTGSEISGGKWVLLEAVSDDLGDARRYEMTTESYEAINQLMEQAGLTKSEGFRLRSLECAYNVIQIGSATHLEWVGVYYLGLTR